MSNEHFFVNIVLEWHYLFSEKKMKEYLVTGLTVQDNSWLLSLLRITPSLT